MNNSTYYDLVNQTFHFPQEGFDVNDNNTLLFMVRVIAAAYSTCATHLADGNTALRFSDFWIWKSKYK